MLIMGFLQESSSATDISWLVWVLLAVFVLMVFLGWWASGRLPKDEETIPLHDGEHGGHEKSALVSQEVVSQAEQLAETPETPAPMAGADDLAVLEGIGPKTAALLTGMGITTFSALAAADPARIKGTLIAAGYGFMDPAGWIEQAELAAAGDEAGLKKLQEALRGGRRAA